MPTALTWQALVLLLFTGCGQPISASKPEPPKKTPQKSVAQADPKPQQSKPEVVEKYVDVPVDTDDEPAPPLKFRPHDVRPKHDDNKLTAAGVQRFESKRLQLYTDIDPEIAETLPPVVDQLYEALVEYFGELPPDEDGAEFQMTGYLIRDEMTFRELGLLEGVPTLIHGKHQANRFWMREQQFDYFRRHLLLHECTHCFMTFVPGAIPPVWYMEGMAEMFGTHRLNDDGKAEFRILPTTSDDVEGWGRIVGVRREQDEGRALTIPGVYDLPHDAFFQPEAYAWSWALCHFFDSHPKYAARFRALGQHLQDGQFPAKFHEAFAHEERNLSTEWTLFQSQLQLGYDTERSAICFQIEKPLEDSESREVTVQASRGWQDAGIRVARGDVIQINATGRFTLNDGEKPWISEPQGVSIRYFNGTPLGRLLACFDADPTENWGFKPGWLHRLRIEPIGKSAMLTIPTNGRLLLRINDAWDALADNDGTVQVTIERRTIP